MYTKTILVSVENADIKDRLINMLGNGKYRILSASDFTDMMELLESYNINLIIAELKMPGISITDFLPYLRKRFRDVKVIVVMNEYSADLDLYLRGYNVSCTLQWPVNRQMIVSIVDRALNIEEEVISS